MTFLGKKGIFLEKIIKILFLGEIIGRPGRKAVLKTLPNLLKKYNPDFTLLNAEQLAGGKGLTLNTVLQMQDAGVDLMTTGNHVWDKREFIEFLDDRSIPVIRPANYPCGVPGRGYQVIKKESKALLVINLMGRSFFRDHFESPFSKADEILKKHSGLDSCPKVIIVDFHAETTSEKVSLGFYLDGRVSAMIGTHTHVPTHDLKILKGGTIYVTDIGMIAPEDSILGEKKEEVLKHHLTQLPHRYKVAPEGPCYFSAIFMEISSKTGKAKKVTKIKKIVKI